MDHSSVTNVDDEVDYVRKMAATCQYILFHNRVLMKNMFQPHDVWS